ncbi:MAG: UvrD-helicase domain-containing protein [Spirochaetales bacterium]
MRYFADFHIHSHYSRATSSRLVPELLDRWAQVKGLAVVGTGDFTHPAWIQELKEKLVPAEEGLFVLSPEVRKQMALNPELLAMPEVRLVEGVTLPEETRFLLSAEISTIYSYGGQVRKLHHIVLAPSFKAADRLRTRLSQIGNLTSDGRPILGIDSRNLLEMVLEADPNCVLIPAHIWTPWFAVLGSKSGFDSIKEAYRDLAGAIFAVETGLSSDPPMNWICTQLDDYAIISNSDAHSPENLGREANQFDTELSYPAMMKALKQAAGRLPDLPDTNGPNYPSVSHNGFLGTLEFFPQEGKYHFDGHRKCGVVRNPVQTVQEGGTCPACAKPLTIGVLHRVLTLADRTCWEDRPRRTNFQSLIPLTEILSELEGTGPTSKAVVASYGNLIHRLGPELWILAEAPLEQIERVGGRPLAEGIRRMRERRIYIEEGFDGEYGRIQVFNPTRIDSRSVNRLPAKASDQSQGTEKSKDAKYKAKAGSSKEKKDAPLFTGSPHSDTALVEEAEDLLGTGAITHGAAGVVLEEANDLPKPRGLLDFTLEELETVKSSLGKKAALSSNPPDVSGYPLQEEGPQSETSPLPTRNRTTVNQVTQNLATGGEFDFSETSALAIAENTPTFGKALNPEQQRAVEHTGGPLLILAGPGTGKTNTLAHRVVFWVKQGIPPKAILALTFTNKAAFEMRERIANLLSTSHAVSDTPHTVPLPQHPNRESINLPYPPKASGFSPVRVCTFHAFGLEILQEYCHRFGRTKDFFLINEEDRERIWKKLGLGQHKTPPAETLLHEEPFKEKSLHEKPFIDNRIPPGGAVQAYKKYLVKINAFDLEDLIALPVHLLTQDITVRKSYQQKYPYILVDEYQDVNELQYQLLRLLAEGENANLTVIGDPDQAIYGFRGSDVRYIKQFTEDYPYSTVIRLSTSYRCPQNILTASRQVLGHNRSRGSSPNLPEASAAINFHKDPFASISQDASPYPFVSTSQAAFSNTSLGDTPDLIYTPGLSSLTKESPVDAHTPSTTPWQPTALDFPKATRFVTSASPPLQSSFSLDVKIQIMEHPTDAAEAEVIARIIEDLVGGLRFFSMDSGVTEGQTEAASLKNIAVLCRTTHQMPCLEKAFEDHSIPYVQVGEKSFLQEGTVVSLIHLGRYLLAPENPYLQDLAEEALKSLKKRKIVPEPLSLQGLHSSMERELLENPAQVPKGSLPARELFKTLLQKLSFTPQREDAVWVDHLFSFAGSHPLTEFLKQASLGSAQDNLLASTDRLILSTLHGVKGLEFDHVFIAGCEEGILPFTLFSERKKNSGEVPDDTANLGALTDTEEERRLLYVGMTRAKKGLYLSWAKKRFIFGREYHLEKSSFLSAIEEELLLRRQIEIKSKPRDSQLLLF